MMPRIIMQGVYPATAKQTWRAPPAHDHGRGPSAGKGDQLDQNAFLKSHSWDESAHWYLGLTDGAADQGDGRRSPDQLKAVCPEISWSGCSLAAGWTVMIWPSW